jgi:signal transduction histidine kinase
MVIGNLLDNAVKFSPQGGRVEVGLARNGGSVRLSVADQGPGIPEEEREAVFARFYQARGNSHGGTGVGLAVVRGLIELHGGHVELASQVGVGSVFTVVLPLG